MPVRSLSSSVQKWPDASVVHEAAAAWAAGQAQRPEVLRVGYFGSYARGDWGVGSDLDLVVVVRSSSLPFERRSLELQAPDLPVPADLLVYTLEEREALVAASHRLSQMLAAATVWLLER
jgi:predicted nucleotidyltransferase